MSGWNPRLASKLLGGVFMMSLIQPLQAADQDIDPELLEFLGDWETDEGEWVDPEQLEKEENEDEQNDEATD